MSIKKLFSKVGANTSSLPKINPESSLPNVNPESWLPNVYSESVPLSETIPGVGFERVREQQRTTRGDVDLPELPSDPGKRPRITTYDPNIRERIRRKYYLSGPCQPKVDDFPRRMIGGTMRKFNHLWYAEFSWLEYSISTDSSFCLYCYLFKNELGHQGGGDTFVTEGFRDWKNKSKFRTHEGGIGSAHWQAFSRCQDLLNQKQHIETIVVKMTDEAKLTYKTQLIASIDCVRFLLTQGLAFRGDDESDASHNRGNFLELMQFLVNHNESVRKVALKNAPGNRLLTSPPIQKDIVHCCAKETTKAIIKELGGGFFSILLDDSRDVSTKEQMSVGLRNQALVDLLNKHGLHISMLRGQGYDGASNMKGEFNGLKAMILNENKTAYYIHCFAHQLQLALVAVAKNLFEKDELREKQAERIIEALENEEIFSGRGLTQERTIIRPCDTRWGSRYNTILSLIKLFDSVIKVLHGVVNDGKISLQRAEANRLIRDLRTFDFAFDLHLMKTVLGITNDLSQTLQRKNQDIVNAMNFVNISKRRLQELRDSGWENLIEDVSDFCIEHGIDVPDMDDVYDGGKKSKRRLEQVTNSHRFRVEVFNTIIDKQLVELNGRFSENFIQNDFQSLEILAMADQLETFILDMRLNMNVTGLGDLAQKLVESKRNLVYPSIYKLITLVLVLPVATATIERAFTAMNVVKNRLRNRMGDDWMNDNLVIYIEKDLFKQVSNETIITEFQQMKERGSQL